MQQPISGVIETVSSKPFQDRRTGNNIYLHSFLLGGTWYRTGQAPIPFGKGQQVNFVADGQNVDVRTMRAVQSTSYTAPAPVAPAPQNDRKGSAGSRDSYWEQKELRDIEREKRFQAINEPRMAMSVAVEAASRVVTAAIANDALSFGNTAKSKRLGMIEDFIKELATSLALFIERAPDTLAEAEANATFAASSAPVEGEE